ncbi:MAG TPA: DUF362 domain-containing protein [Candidatus Sulfomarinibacteraceae bacterium]|nr:DUF362 domain-containing protein [Candidatus Sulfomarinibacteraceae bacterium]
MTDGLNRRRFVTAAGSACVGLAVDGALGSAPAEVASPPADLAVAADPDPRAATERALAAVLGASALVGRTSTVLVNANTAFRRRGSIVRPEVLLVVLRRCFADGASRVELVKAVPAGYWDPVAGEPGAAELIRSVDRCPTRMHDVPLPGASRLAEARCLAALGDADYLVNVSVAKDHVGVRFSGALKNVMGLTAFRPTNLFCHRGSEPERRDTDVGHLAACIAELNLLRRPDVHVLDATEFLVSGGPRGPGELGRADLVIAARDPVAADVRAMAVVGRTSAEVPVIGHAVALGLGVADLSSLAVVEHASASG